MESHSRNIRGPIYLFLTAFIWGTAFVAQSVGTEYVGAFTFNMSRSVLAGLFLLPVIAVMSRRKAGGAGAAALQGAAPDEKKRERKLLITGGVVCGIVLCVSSNLQQIGIGYTTVGKAGFITAMYIILVPVFSIFLHKKAGIKLWISVVIAVAGLYLLCMNGSFSVAKGDLIVLLCAVSFAIHILAVSYFSPKVDGVKMSCIQFWVVAALSAVGMLLFERPDPKAVLDAWMPVCYAGILSSGVGYTLQIVGQRDMNPTVASLIMSLESVISVIAGWAILHQTMGAREIWGCVLMFAAIVLAQIPDRRAGEAPVPRDAGSRSPGGEKAGQERNTI